MTETLTKTRPILFSTPMVRALLNGTKTQSRRIVKPVPSQKKYVAETWHREPTPAEWNTMAGESHLALMASFNIDRPSPYGKVGDILWVRETFFEGYPMQEDGTLSEETAYWYKADTPTDVRPGDVSDEWCINEFGSMNKECWPRWKPSLFMPRDAARLYLQITDVAIERLQDITEDDAIAEGISIVDKLGDGAHYHYEVKGTDILGISPTLAYRALWEKINGPGSWQANPYIWKLTFNRIEKP